MDENIINANSLELKWNETFKDIMNNGGFDIILGNPPYIVKSTDYFHGYELVKENYNTYAAFVELGSRLLNHSGKLAFIIPLTWFSGEKYYKMRDYILTNMNLLQLIQLPYDMFEAYVDTVILIFDKKTIKNSNVKIYKHYIREKQTNLCLNSFKIVKKDIWTKSEEKNIFLDIEILTIKNKYEKIESKQLGEIASTINRGSLPPHRDIIVDPDNKNAIKWFDGQIYRYTTTKSSNIYVDYSKLKENKPIEIFNKPKILGRQLVSRSFRLQFDYVTESFAFKKNLYAIFVNDENFNPYYVLAILNSLLFSFIQVKSNASAQRDDFPAYSLKDFKKFLIPKISLDNQEKFIIKSKELSKLNKEIVNEVDTLKKIILANYEFKGKLSFIESFYELSEKEFITKFNKAVRTKVTLIKQAEILELFESKKEKCISILNNIKSNEKILDRYVYELYGLTNKEIELINECYK